MEGISLEVSIHFAAQSSDLHTRFWCGENCHGQIRLEVANDERTKHQFLCLFKLMETYRACGMMNFLTSTETLSGLNSPKTMSAMSTASFSINFQLFPSPNFKSRCVTVK